MASEETAGGGGGWITFEAGEGLLFAACRGFLFVAIYFHRRKNNDYDYDTNYMYIYIFF